jgi:hypothetical protein
MKKNLFKVYCRPRAGGEPGIKTIATEAHGKHGINLSVGTDEYEELRTPQV